MFDGLFLLGAVSSSQHVKERAARSGQRAIAAGQRISKSAPKLSRAIVAAGQKALALGRKGSQTPALPGATKTTAKSATAAPAAPASPRSRMPAPSAAQARARQATMARRTRDTALAPGRAAAAIKSAAKRRGTRLGDDGDYGDEELTGEEQQQADVYSDLADAATNLADFLGQIQDLLAVLPKTIPLYPDGEAKIEQMQIWFADPVERALSGDQQALSRARGIVEAVKTIMDEAANPGPSSIWSWIRNANAYARAKGLGVQTPSTSDQPAPAGAVASISVSPAVVTLPVGTQQSFVANVLDASGRSVTPKSAITWSVAQGLGAQTLMATPQGAIIDATGTLTVTAPGTYTVKATADGISGTARISAQAGVITTPGEQSMPMPAGGGGSYQPPPSYGADSGYGGDEDYYDEGGSDEGRGGLYDYAVSEDDYAEGSTDGSVLDEDHEDAYGDGSEDSSEDADVMGGLALLGHRGGGGRSGRHHGPGGRHHRGGRSNWGGGYAIYPWPIYSEGIEVEDALVEEPLDVDKLAQKIAEHLKNGDAKEADGIEMLGGLVHSRGDYKSAVAQLRASAENLNQTAKDEPGWKALYENALALYARYYDVGFFEAVNPFSDKALSQDAWESIANTQRRVDEFATQMRTQGKKVVEPEHKPVEGPLDELKKGADWFGKVLPWLVGGGVALLAAPVAVQMVAAYRLGSAVAGRSTS